VAAVGRRRGRLGALRRTVDDDTEAVNFIMHTPSGDSVPETREPGGDRSFFPASNPEIWLKQGDPTIYTTQPATG
jgi:alpha-amylase